MGSDRQSRATITVVIPSRNDAAMLAVCLEHLAVQTRTADMVIVVRPDRRQSLK